MERTQEEYLEDYLKLVKNDPDFEVPQIEAEPDEDLVEATMKYLQNNNIFQDGKIDWEKFEQFDPNLFKVVWASVAAETQYTLDSLIELGYVMQSVNESGEFIYAITPEGEELAKSLGI